MNVCKRLRAKSWPLLQHVIQRYLTVSETSVALRPFYFAVHPDLFGRHPRERAVNEDSLKQLNEYLESLHGDKTVRPSTLTFYIRAPGAQQQNITHKHSKEPFQEVRVTLLSNIQDTVKTLLRTCNLPLDYVDSIRPSTCRPGTTKFSSHPFKQRPFWEQDDVLSDLYGFRYPFGYSVPKKPELTLSTWLQRNISKARKNQTAVEPVWQDIQQISRALEEKTGLKAIKWRNRWGLVQFRACLNRFAKLYDQHLTELCLQGHTLVFGTENGVCLRGDIILCRDDVPHNWLSVLKSVRRHDAFLDRLPAAEQELSLLLNNVQVVRRTHHPIILAEEYLRQLQLLNAAIKKYQADPASQLLQGNYSDIQLFVECATGPLTLSFLGQILVPSSCPGFLIVDFLAKNSELARMKQNVYHRGAEVEQCVAEKLKKELSLCTIKRDRNVSVEQMESCCKRLLQHHRQLNVCLEGCRIKVGMFYSVMSDGEICIPWNWVGSVN